MQQTKKNGTVTWVGLGMTCIVLLVAAVLSFGSVRNAASANSSRIGKLEAMGETIISMREDIRELKTLITAWGPPPARR